MVKNTNGSKVLERKSFAKVSGNLVLPNLIAIQTDSFAKFIHDENGDPKMLFKNDGMEEAFNEVFPIIGPGENLELHYISYHLEEPRFTIEECKEKDATFARPLKVLLRMKNNVTGETQESEVYMGDIPMMTKAGTFIINGAERVIISQLSRAAGAPFSFSRDPKNDCMIYNGDVIPERGTYLQFENDNKNCLYVRINRKGRVPATTFLTALGFTEYKYYELFGTNSDILNESLSRKENLLFKEENTVSRDIIIKNAIKEIHEKIKSGEITTDEGAVISLAQNFFDERRYDLGKVGRYKLQTKLGLYNRLFNSRIAEDLLDENGEVIFKAGSIINETRLNKIKDMRIFEKGAHKVELPFLNQKLEEHNCVNTIKVYSKINKDKIIEVVGTDLTIEQTTLSLPDILATISYLLNLAEGIGEKDDIDFLGNRRIRTTGELVQNQFRVGLGRVEKAIKEKMSTSNMRRDDENDPNKKALTIKDLINSKQLTSALNEFFNSGQLSQFMDQINPLSELSNKRRLTVLGPGGISKDRASNEIRDVQSSYYGRICPIETPEGQNVGLINNPCTYARVNDKGFIETPYRRVNKETLEVLHDDIVYLTADQEILRNIAEADIPLENGRIKDEFVLVRYNGEYRQVPREDVDFVDVSPQQIVSVSTACIPFLENDDQHRAMMGANMQKQAIPLLKPESPYVGTGLEKVIARDSGLSIIADEDGVVTYVDGSTIKLNCGTGKNKHEVTYKLIKYARSNQGTNITQNPIVSVGQEVHVGDVLADGPSMDHGELALGQNVTVAFMTWQGYNFEDAVIMSERMVKDDIFTSINIERYDCEIRENKLIGNERFSRDLPNVSSSLTVNLDADGIVIPGTEVHEGDILVGKITPKGKKDKDGTSSLLDAILGEKAGDYKNTSLVVPHGGDGIVIAVKIFERGDKGVTLSNEVQKKVRVFIAQKRKIVEGDKMAGRHGNKGVISRIVPIEDMPYLADGTPVDLLLSPMGIPSRMNIGQVLELHLGEAAKRLGFKVATPVFDGVTNEELAKLMDEAGMDPDGKTVLYDGRTGEPFEQRIAVGTMYMIKLSHMVEDKLHARATGPYAIVTQQPIGGKAHNGGQRFGEMEVWALEAYGAANTLQEMLTIKSDDLVGRNNTYNAIEKGFYNLPKAVIPEAFKVLVKELQGLAIDVKLFETDGSQISMDDIYEQIKESRKIINKELYQKNNDFEEDNEIPVEQISLLDDSDDDDYE